MGWKLTDYPEPEWNAENMNRDRKALTFKQCGWCNFGSGTHRYDCMLDGSCDILNNTVDDYKDWKDKTQIHWDTKCKIMEMSEAEARYWVKHYDYKIKNALQSLERLRNQKAELNNIVEQLEYLPPIPSMRNGDPKVGDRVRVYIGDIKGKPDKYPKMWYKATVVYGYRTYDGCISYVIDSIPESKGGWGNGASRPEVITEDDYQFFKQHPDLFERWKMLIKTKDKYMEFDADAMTLDGEQ